MRQLTFYSMILAATIRFTIAQFASARNEFSQALKDGMTLIR
ncbi:MAG TPA: hypothetical protein V6D10_19490 [Trichocoleus sp.]